MAVAASSCFACEPEMRQLEPLLWQPLPLLDSAKTEVWFGLSWACCDMGKSRCSGCLQSPMLALSLQVQSWLVRWRAQPSKCTTVPGGAPLSQLLSAILSSSTPPVLCIFRTLLCCLTEQYSTFINCCVDTSNMCAHPDTMLKACCTAGPGSGRFRTGNPPTCRLWPC